MTARLSLIAASALALIGAARIVSTYQVFSQTWDEPSSVSCGMEWLQGSYRRDTKHPPLGRVATAIGLYLRGARSNGQLNQYRDGNAILESAGKYRSNLALARLGVLPFFLIACAVVWAWATWAYGRAAAVVAVLLFSSAPPVLAHAGVAMTDMVLPATLSAALFAFCLWMDRPTARRSILLGAAAGLAILSEFTALAFFAFCVPLLIVASRAFRRVAEFRNILLAALVAVAVIAAGYRFSLSPALDGIHQIWLHNSEGHPNYFLGERRTAGWWSYYPILLAVKTPVAFLILIAAGILFLARQRWQAWSPAVAAAGILMTGFLSYINTGIRHILPIYVMLAAVAAFGAVSLFAAGKIPRILCVALLAWQAVSSALAHPDYLAYFNELGAGGQTGKFGVDSDLDWGQDLWRLRDACARHGVDSLWIAYNGSADLDQFGLPPWRDLPPGAPQTGWVAISIYRLKLGKSLDDFLDDPAAYAWLEKRQPIEQVGKSMRLYFVP